MKRRRFLAIAATALTGGFTKSDPAHAARMTMTAMGAEIEITLDGPGAEETLEMIPGLLADLEQRFSLYRQQSELSRLNETGRLDAPNAKWIAILGLVDRIHAMTGGLFDPTVQPLWRELAHNKDGKAARALIGWERVVVQSDYITLGPGQQLTLNGIAQGFAADQVKSWLFGRGYRHALINCGEFAALGDGWTIGIEDPAEGLVGKQRLNGTALAVSSPYATLVGGGPHILGPRGEIPQWSTVAIEADRAGLADGLSTAAVFMTRASLQQLMNAHPDLRRITLVDDAGNLETLHPEDKA